MAVGDRDFDARFERMQEQMREMREHMTERMARASGGPTAQGPRGHEQIAQRLARSSPYPVDNTVRRVVELDAVVSRDSAERELPPPGLATLLDGWSATYPVSDSLSLLAVSAWTDGDAMTVLLDRLQERELVPALGAAPPAASRAEAARAFESMILYRYECMAREWILRRLTAGLGHELRIRRYGLAFADTRFQVVLGHDRAPQRFPSETSSLEQPRVLRRYGGLAHEGP